MNGLEFEVGSELNIRNLNLATAESCTGGLIANRITNIPGSSKYFERGVVTYSNRSKIELLGVTEKTIEKYGAVSEQTASAMAIRIKELASTDLGLGVTGIAGPSGGTQEKPVGLVYIGLADAINVNVFEFRFNGSRLEIKQQTADAALRIIMDYLNSL
jgi:nicotinamide-nucleotide amidase